MRHIDMREPIKVNAATARILCQEQNVKYADYMAAGHLNIAPDVRLVRCGRSNYLHDFSDDHDVQRDHADLRDLPYLRPARSLAEIREQRDQAQEAKIRRSLMAHRPELRLQDEQVQTLRERLYALTG